MFPFWEKVVAPVLEAAGARRVVEIGALRGEQTRLILDRLGPDAELHVIDPVPEFDPEAHRERFGPRYVFHRALSLDVLGTLPPMDAALVDGDHNWYTVLNELRLLGQVARDHDAPLPVLVLHDVGWPYGRRDLYYDPENVPAEHRQPWDHQGVRPGNPGLVGGGGLNPTMANARQEGGPCNGVRTALDDFVAEWDQPLRQVILPVYFGLAIVVEEARLARQPELAAVLDHLESPAGKDLLIELAEAMRIEAMIFQHRIYFQNEATIEGLAERYLDSVVRGLVDEHYLENEIRLAHLADAITRPKPVELPRLRDPQRHDQEALERLRHQRRTGEAPAEGPLPTGYAYAPAGRPGLEALQASLDQVRSHHVAGHLVSCGEGRGGAGIFLRAYLSAYDLTGRDVWLAGRWRAAADGRTTFTEADGLAGLRPDLNLIRDGFDRFGVLDDRTHFLQGDPAATLPDAPVDEIALLHLGAELGASARTVLDHLYPRLSVDGDVVVEGADPETLAAVEAYRHAHGITAPARRVGPAGLTWRKASSAPPSPAPAEPATRAGAARAPLAMPAASGAKDLSVVVVFYDMAREAPRTLHALSRAYQQGVDDLDYEVVVVENGSAPDQRLGAELVAGFGPEFRYLDLGAEATPTPATALNRGIAASVGHAVALMVDGAHLLTPGVLRQAMVGLAAYAPAVVAVQPWYLGPGQQGEVMRSGYDQATEDALLTKVGWPANGYGLFDISHFQGDRDWLDGLWESNCLVVPRARLEQVGGFDEGFHNAGGGFTNLDLYERLAAGPETTLVSVLGEGSFHQVHGGTTTNQVDPAERRQRVFSYAERYAELRGRPYTGPEKQIHYVGSFHGDAARRTRARRMTGAAFDVDPALEGVGGPAAKAVPMPDDLRDAFVAAYWRSLAWRTTTWHGARAWNAPTDLLTYQDLVFEVRPDVVIETGTRHGGRALFFAELMDLIGHGQVISIDSRPPEDRPEHPRITYLAGRAHDDEVVEQVRALAGPDARGLVVLGTRGAQRRMHAEFEAYAPFVPVGSYVVMEHTILNGRPVDASNGPGPFEAVRRILNLRGDFMADDTREQHGLTFNPGGYLKRVS